jgi:GNAT superfamily N-acetyltransferase
MVTKLDERIEISLPDGFTVRGAGLEDVETAIAMYNRWAQGVIGEDEINDANAIRTEWISPGFDPAEDIRLVFAPDGTLAGYIEVWTTFKPPVHPWIWGRVHPDYDGLGIGSWMLAWAENRALRALDEIPSDLRFAPRIGIYSQARKSQNFFKESGYAYLRSSYRMLIHFEAPPPAPVWPQGLDIRNYNPETDLEAVYLADQDAFRDHFGFVEMPLKEGVERFKHFMTGYEGFDPSLWYIAWDGEQVAGICLGRPHSYDDPNLGFINTLGVRRPWRKRGLGLAFLHHAFGEFYRRGKRKAGLGVDAQNLTGALRLYEKAGMRVHMQFDLFEKELRPGREISVQSLDD